MSDTYGQTSLMPFAQYDPATRSWKTSQATSLWALPMSSLTLPKSGGLVNGELFERPMLAPPTAESASSSLLATPTTMDDLPAREGEAYEKARLHGGRTKRAATGNLREQVIHALPTPTARDHKDTTVEVAKHRPEDTDTLNRALAHLLPTPLTTDYNTPASEWTPDRDRLQLRDINAMLPTPRSRLEGNQQCKGRNKSNLEDVAELFGESTPPQLPDGSLF